jgi:hypothetical protein
MKAAFSSAFPAKWILLCQEVNIKNRLYFNHIYASAFDSASEAFIYAWTAWSYDFAILKAVALYTKKNEFNRKDTRAVSLFLPARS